MGIFDVILLALVEGLTEYIPVSSTGHLILTQAALGIESSTMVTANHVLIQFGAILSVLTLYARTLYASPQLVGRVAVAFLPAIGAGLLLHEWVEVWLRSVSVVAWALAIGGLALILIERAAPREERSLDGLTYPTALLIGVAQCAAMIPGVSRSAATIIGGRVLGLTRVASAEFSFLLAIPTLSAASALTLIKHGASFTGHDWAMIALGNLISFAVSVVAIRWFMHWVGRVGFFPFGVYRIVIGTVILLLLAFNVPLTLV